MEDNSRNIVETAEYEPNRIVIVKWVQILFVCQVVRVVIVLINAIPEIPSFTNWISSIVSAIVIFALFQLAIVNERYRKASIFYCVSVGGAIVVSLLNMSLLALPLSICAIIASYHEFNAYSEITASKDIKLSNRWHSLFYVEIFTGIIAGTIGVVPMIIAAFAGVDTEVLISLFTLVLAMINVVVELLHVVYLKQTISLYQKLES